MPATIASSTRYAAVPATLRRTEVRVALWPVLIVLYATLLPREVRFQIGSLQFFADRVGLILVLPYVIRKLLEGAIRFVLPDFLVLFCGVWMIVAMSSVYGFADGLQRGGSIALDSTVGYYLARISFRSLRDIRYVLILFAPGLLVAGGFIAIESILHRPIVIPFAQRFFGALPLYIGGEVTSQANNSREQVRLGLMRAQGSFSHPILAGSYLVTLLPLYLRSGLRGWPRTMGIVACLCAFFSVSSAPLLGMVLIVGFIVFDHISPRLQGFGWKGLLTGIAVFLLMIQFTTSNGIFGLIGRFTLDPQTAYFRRLIWQFASLSVEQHPWFGIGFAGYERPVWMITSSIDAHWLLLAVRFGLPEAIGLLTATIVTLVAVSRASVRVTGHDRNFYRAIAISLGVMTLIMFTVTLWGAALNLFTLILGGSVACAQRSFSRTAAADKRRASVWASNQNISSRIA